VYVHCFSDLPIKLPIFNHESIFLLKSYYVKMMKVQRDEWRMTAKSQKESFQRLSEHWGGHVVLNKTCDWIHCDGK
jgi:hypothetical protein